MKIRVLCTDAAHPVNAWLERWALTLASHDVKIFRDFKELDGDGDFLFLISCHQIIRRDVRDRFRHTLVIHGSDLPKGRGWSPLIWELVGGAERVTVSLLDAEDALDSGDIWAQREIAFDGTELHDEINAKLFAAEIDLMNWAVAHCDATLPRAQVGEASYWPKRTPADSEVDPAKPLAESFDLLRVADSDRYPAFFVYRGQKYRLRIEKM